MITDPLFYLAAAPAVLLMGLAKSGFAGLGLLSLPLIALVVSPVQAAAIMLPILIAQDVVTVWAYRHTWNGRNLAVLLPAATLGVGLGYLLAAQVSDAAVALAIGVISIAFALWRLARDVFIGTGAILFAVTNWIKLPPYVALGQLTRENLLTSAALFPLAVGATWLGVLLVRHVSGERFYTA